MEIGPEDAAANSMSYIQQMMMIIPVDSDVKETQRVTQEYRDERPKRIKGGLVRRFQLEDHDRDYDGNNAIAECFES